MSEQPTADATQTPQPEAQNAAVAAAVPAAADPLLGAGIGASGQPVVSVAMPVPQINNQPEEQEKKGLGIGVVGGTVAVVGGLGAGAVADNLVVTSTLKHNLAKPYVDGIKNINEATFNAAKSSFASGNAAEMTTAAKDLFQDWRHDVHDAIQTANSAQTQSLANPATSLGKAKTSYNTKYPWTTPEGATYWEGRLKVHYDKFEAQAKKIEAIAAGPARETAVNEMMELIKKEAQEFDKANAVLKVKEMPWLSRLNLFSKDLHLSGGQKGVAFAAGAFTAVIGAVALGMGARWLNSGKDQGPQK